MVNLILLIGFPALAAEDNDPLDFAFIQDAPGEKIAIGGFRLHVDCRGSGNTTVLFEAGLGGNSMEWIPVQDQIADRARACIYDRAGYAWSDPSLQPGHATMLAQNAHTLLSKMNITGSLVLVGHSFGGYIVRELALLRPSDMIGMVLVDASHEDQLMRLEALDGKNMMPRDGNFVVSPASVPESLPIELQRKIKAFSRMRKTYAALRSEMQYFRESARQVKRHRTLVDYPVTVISRGLDLYASDALGVEKTAIWDELQKDLTALSTRSARIVASHSGHHVHTDNPAIIVKAIFNILDLHEQTDGDRSQ